MIRIEADVVVDRKEEARVFQDEKLGSTGAYVRTDSRMVANQFNL